MGQYKIVFSDVDGTLLNSAHHVTQLTREAVLQLTGKGIPFVIVSARSPSGIYPILEENGFFCPLICYSGSLILDENRKVLFHDGMDQQEAVKLTCYLDSWRKDLSWCLYSLDRWLVKDRSDPRIIREEQIVKARSEEGIPELLPPDAKVNKLLCICEKEKTLEIEEDLKKNFPGYAIVKSSDMLIEIMKKGTSKAEAVRRYCSIKQIRVEEAMAFGDNFNDLDMLQQVGCGILMDNAPLAMKEKISRRTMDNDHDGIYRSLVEAGMVDEQ